MKKSARYALLLVMFPAALAACRDGRYAALQDRQTDADTLGAPHISLPLTPEADSAWSQLMRDRQTELDYYLDRHNVSDEGYEMVAAFAAGQRHREQLDTIPVYNVGRWKDHPRQGTAISRDSLGRIIIGQWDNDTLVSGIRIDSAGVYQGAFTGGTMAEGAGIGAKADGHGSYLSTDDRYFEGHWSQDLREGFGLQQLENEVATVLKTGQWQKDRFMGERMNYTSERIYGIDISRYQHGKGRKKYPIHWQQLRISHLGSKSKKQISGTVDYPVSFVFIKSTESTVVRNPYYAQDYAACHRAGIPIGAYHFFSTKRTGAAQAQYFLQNTRFQKGDLPPVLDIEPTDHAIASMGGPTALFSNIRAWLRAVEARCGAKPILYVNQRFVNKYLSEAPDLKRDYKVWIARYGEYKPDVKLVVWQLSPDGRVRGITGDVDINVFNGYQQQFDDFLDRETLK